MFVLLILFSCGLFDDDHYDHRSELIDDVEQRIREHNELMSFSPSKVNAENVVSMADQVKRHLGDKLDLYKINKVFELYNKLAKQDIDLKEDEISDLYISLFATLRDILFSEKNLNISYFRHLITFDSAILDSDNNLNTVEDLIFRFGYFVLDECLKQLHINGYDSMNFLNKLDNELMEMDSDILELCLKNELIEKYVSNNGSRDLLYSLLKNKIKTIGRKKALDLIIEYANETIALLFVDNISLKSEVFELLKVSVNYSLENLFDKIIEIKGDYNIDLAKQNIYDIVVSAIRKQNNHITCVLLQKSSNLNEGVIKKFVEIAISNESIDILTSLFEYVENKKHFIDKNEFIFLAISNSNRDALAFLIDNGADVKKASYSYHGSTPLHFVSSLNLHSDTKIFIAEKLIEAGVYINIKDKYGKTPLDCAVKFKNTNNIFNLHFDKYTTFLIDRGAERSHLILNIFFY